MEIKKNRGYSLVEMIIVLAIVIILAGLSLVSLTLVNTARAKDASNKFGSEVSQVRKKAIEMKPAKANDPYFDDTKADNYRFGIVIYKNDGKFQTEQVIVEKTASGTYKYRDGGTAGVSHSYPAYDSSGTPIRENVQYSSKVDVTFEGHYVSFVDGSSWDTTDKKKPGAIDTDDAICILFDKHGNCVSGYGEYRFYKRNSNQVARVVVRQNGSIEIR